MPTSMDILDHATRITLDSIWNSMVQEAIQNTLEGEHYERAIRSKSSGHGS